MREKPSTVSNRIRKTAIYARVAATLGLAVFAGIFCWLAYQSVFNGPEADAFLVEQTEAKTTVVTLTGLQRAGFFALFLVHELPGIAGLVAAWRLFSSYARGAIFTVGAARRLRLVGWAVVLLSPISTLAESLAVGYLKYLEKPGGAVVDISLGEGDIYAIVFGLLIVVVGHIMYEAVRLSDENRAFV